MRKFRQPGFIRYFLAALFFLVSSLSFANQEKPAQFSYSAEITWSTDIPSSSQVEYGVEEGSYPNKTSIKADLVTSHNVLITSLAPATLYHYRVRSKDSSGNEIISKDFTLMIADGSAKAPLEISDVKASNIVAAGISSSGTQDVQISGKTRQQILAMALLEKQRGAAATTADDPKDAPSGTMVVKEEPIERTLIQKGGLLLAQNKFQLEPSFTYAHISANKITVQGFAILPIFVLGEISSETVKRDIFISAASLRYGVLNNLQWNFKVPYRYQHERIATSTSVESTRSLSGIGDIETGLSYQLLYEDGALPGLIGGVGVKSNTGKSPYGRQIGLGTGHWGIKPSLVWVKSSDPAILFGSLGYVWNIQRDIDNFGDVDPGDALEYSLGLAIALNYQTALNFQIEHQITDKMRMNDTPVPGSFTNAASFKTGFTYSISKNLALDVVTSYGLSEDAPDFVLELRLPYTF